MNTKQTKIKSLIGIRFICILGIYMYHANPFYVNTNGLAYNIVNQFFSFVSFFFVLSGFVIYYQYGEKLIKNKQALKNYFIARFARIFPLLLLMLLGSMIVGYYNGLYSDKWKVFLLNISFLKGFSERYLLTMIGPSWSLSVDVLFYLMAPFIFLFWEKATPYVIVFITMLFGYLLFSLFQLFNSSWFVDFNFVWLYTFFGRILEFILGIALAKIVKNEIKYFVKPVSAFIIAMGILVFSFGALTYFGYSNSNTSGIKTLSGAIIHNLILPLGIFFFYYWLIFSKNYFIQILETKVFQILGNATYSLYLIHTSIFLSLFQNYISKNYMFTLSFILVLGVIIYYLIEQPIYLAMKNKIKF